MEKFFVKFLKRKQISLLIVGLDSAGKSTIFNKLASKEVEQLKPLPTIGFNVTTYQYRNVDFTLWDLGGQAKLRSLWRFYCKNIFAIVFVIDASESERIDDAAHELNKLLNNTELSTAVLLVMANKQDLPNTMNVHEIAHRLNLNRIKNRPWYIQKTSAVYGSGILDGIYWIFCQLDTCKKNSIVYKSNKLVLS